MDNAETFMQFAIPFLLGADVKCSVSADSITCCLVYRRIAIMETQNRIVQSDTRQYQAATSFSIFSR